MHTPQRIPAQRGATETDHALELLERAARDARAQARDGDADRIQGQLDRLRDEWTARRG